jgi:hypothetical protein
MPDSNFAIAIICGSFLLKIFYLGFESHLLYVRHCDYCLINSLGYFILFLAVLGFELKTSHLQARSSTT